jgi:mitotic spindle assembly checkpoint protein MAD2
MEIQKQTIKQIRSILRQITSSVSYLPELDEECKCFVSGGALCFVNSDFLGTFNVLVYGDKDIEVPVAWGDSDAHLIKGGGEHLRLKPFSTLVHRVEPFVAYKMDDSL